jgi:hypothetical protein
VKDKLNEREQKMVPMIFGASLVGVGIVYLAGYVVGYWNGSRHSTEKRVDDEQDLQTKVLCE